MQKHRSLTRSFRRALRRSTLSVRVIAGEMGVSPATLELYLNRQAPSAQMAVRLRRWLDGHIKELVAIAAELPRKEDT